MLTTKKQIPTSLFFPDKGILTCYELISYHFVIIIGLQKYGFSLNWQTIFVYFSSRLFY